MNENKFFCLLEGKKRGTRTTSFGGDSVFCYEPNEYKGCNKRTDCGADYCLYNDYIKIDELSDFKGYCVDYQTHCANYIDKDGNIISKNSY